MSCDCNNDWDKCDDRHDSCDERRPERHEDCHPQRRGCCFGRMNCGCNNNRDCCGCGERCKPRFERRCYKWETICEKKIEWRPIERCSFKKVCIPIECPKCCKPKNNCCCDR